MTVSRRFFLKSTCGAVVAISATTMLIDQFSSGSTSSKTLVCNILTKRFPGLEPDGEELKKFIDYLVQRDVKEVGASGVSTAMAVDEQLPIMTLERYVAREFVLNTNYFYIKQSNAMENLKFTPFYNPA